MDALAVTLLQDHGFEITPDNLAMLGSYIQHSNQADDTIDPYAMAKMLRKQIANGLAFYLVKPERRPDAKKVEEPVITGELPNEAGE